MQKYDKKDDQAVITNDQQYTELYVCIDNRTKYFCSVRDAENLLLDKKENNNLQVQRCLGSSGGDQKMFYENHV